MTSDAVPAGGDPRRLLTEARDLAHRVRLAQRVTWLPLLVLGLVTLGAIPAYRYGHTVVSNCKPMGDGGQACQVWFQTATFYWWTALVLGYVVSAVGYLRVARARGLETRIAPYAIAGIAMLALFTTLHVFVARELLPPPDLERPLPWVVLALFRLTDFSGSVGLALLVLAWLERHPALLLFALGYLVVVIVPMNFGWGNHWGDKWGFAPMLVISGGVLLLGSAGFALAQRLRRPR
ncbi:hypothetical protein I0C86_01235 [Plantactinospora sp. S1510]|uniref:ABC transporter permease n=1 Tax=Plantactinospora alkalitolerans TaxID=2789879 RepID=A0ABS0GN65_9ACTN|nr:hypothetical protein [Plantactinospora alkalitolerans]MBF9127627.1 hypothetical protein [Plantactinospora alkalitolerans]